MTRDSVTLEVRRGTRPETVLAAIRDQAPGLLMEAPEPPLPSRPARRVEAEPLLTPAEVRGIFGVHPNTVTRWANSGKLTSIRTLGGHRRFLESEVRALMDGSDTGIPREV